jgi:hypothetical protein
VDPMFWVGDGYILLNVSKKGGPGCPAGSSRNCEFMLITIGNKAQIHHHATQKEEENKCR